MNVFVSSTYEDLKEYRTQIARLIENLGHTPIVMEKFFPTSATPKSESLRYLKTADLFIGIYAHKYGSIPKGDSESLCEQEYHFAVKNEIPLSLFVVDPYCQWPNKYREDEQEKKDKLRQFHSLITGLHIVMKFENLNDILVFLPPSIPKAEKAELRKWKARAEKVTSDEKLAILNSLVMEHSLQHLSGDALITSTDLISSDFQPSFPPPKTELIEIVGNLLEQPAQLSFFSREATKLVRKSLFTRIVSNRWMIPMAMFFGLAIGIASYVLNWFNVRVEYLAGHNSDPINVIEWLVSKQVEPNIIMDKPKAPGTQKALFALRMAYEIDNNSLRINEYIEQHIRDIGKLTRIGEPSYQLLENNLKVLKEICVEVAFPAACKEADVLQHRLGRMADSLRAISLADSLNLLLEDADVSDSTLLTGYQNLMQLYSSYIDSVTVMSRIGMLKKAILEHKEQVASVQGDSMTISELLTSWQTFFKSRFRASPAKIYADDQIERLQKLISNNASIKTPDHIVTCRSVEELQPNGVSMKFKPGKIYVWARINAPRKDKITVKWYAGEKPFYTRSIAVPKSTGYRVYFSKVYNSSNEGRNEVRLYNSKDALIGRRVFQVTVNRVKAKQ